MTIEEILESGADITLTIKSSDLKEFADCLVNRTVEAIKESFIKQEDDYITIPETSRLLHVDKSTLWRWAKNGYLTPVEIGARRLYRKSDVSALLNNNEKASY